MQITADLPGQYMQLHWINFPQLIANYNCDHCPDIVIWSTTIVYMEYGLELFVANISNMCAAESNIHQYEDSSDACSLDNIIRSILHP